LREHSTTIPKPLVNIGSRPVLWHLMRYYAHYGHTDFVLALGYRGDMVREYFLNYSEAMSNDFTLSDGGKKVDLHSHDMQDWRVTFVDTGLHSNIGQRLLRVRKYLESEPAFLANYSDGLSDVPLDRQIQEFNSRNAIASFVAVRSAQSFHAVIAGEDGVVNQMGVMTDQALLINGGFFVLRSEIFNYIKEGDELVEQPFARLITERKLVTFPWDGFWQCMDTFKDKITLDRMEARGACPWMVWQK
jgi:glucose-1-phosphate cytidylyltransferase